MRFKLEIECDNAAFDLPADDVVGDECCNEVARILRHVASELTSETGGGPPDAYTVILRDINGNKVGKACFDGE